MTRARAFLAILCCCLALAAARPSLAAGDPAPGRAAFEDGQQQFLAGNYRGALASFKRGYESTNDVAFLLNMAQCYRYLGEVDEALKTYRQFLKLTPQSGRQEARDVATQAIRELESQKGDAASSSAGAETKGAKPRPLPSARAFPTFTALSEADAKKAALPPPPPKPAQDPGIIGRRLRLAGLISGAIGVGSLGAGIYYYTRASSLSDSASTATIYKQADYDAGKRAETMQIVCYGIGTAAIVTGAALYAYGRWLPTTKQPSVSLAPMVGPGAAGLQAQGAF